MKKFKQGDYIIYNNTLFYVSKYLDLQGDFIFLTNNRDNYFLKNYSVKQNMHFLSEELYNNLLIEAEKLKFENVLFISNRASIYTEFKFATRQKLINILNR